jgi:hypothetical protein
MNTLFFSRIIMSRDERICQDTQLGYASSATCTSDTVAAINRYVSSNPQNDKTQNEKTRVGTCPVSMGALNLYH